MIDLSDDTLWLGSVTATALAVTPVTVAPGQMAYVTTYGFPLPSAAQTDAGFTAASADAACRHVIYGSVFAAFDKPICAAAAMPTKEDTAVATLNVSG